MILNRRNASVTSELPKFRPHAFVGLFVRNGPRSPPFGPGQPNGVFYKAIATAYIILLSIFLPFIHSIGLGVSPETKFTSLVYRRIHYYFRLQVHRSFSKLSNPAVLCHRATAFPEPDSRHWPSR